MDGLCSCAPLSQDASVLVPKVLGMDFAIPVVLAEIFGRSFFYDVPLACSRLARA